MQAKTRRKLAVAARVLEFFRAHPSEQPSYREAIRKLEACYARAEALVASRQTGAEELQAATARRDELSSRIRNGLVPQLTRVGQGGGLHCAIRGANDRGLVLVVERHLDGAAIEPGAFEDLKRGVEELRSLLDTIEGLSRDSDRQASELAKEILETSRLIAELDGLNRHRFRVDGRLLDEWAAVRNERGPFRPRAA